MTTHKCSMALRCKSEDCKHAKDHVPDRCDCNAPCGCWPNDTRFQPMVICIPKEQVKALEDCPDCGKKEAKGHHPGDCISNLKVQLRACFQIKPKEWIKVEDRLPELGVKVLCYQPKSESVSGKQTWKPRVLLGYLFEFEPGERSGGINLYKIGDHAHSLFGGGKYWAFPYVCHQNFVTHWMPNQEGPE